MPAKRKPPRASTNGNVRLVLQLYNLRLHQYREGGMSISAIKVQNRRELDRLWGMLQEVIEDRWWTDRRQATAAAPVPVDQQLKMD
jgi:hypothetical protein